MLRIFVSEICSLQDCLKYGLDSNDSWHNIQSPNVGSVSNGEFAGYNKILDVDMDWSEDWEITADYKQSAYRVAFIVCDETQTSYDKDRYGILLNATSSPKARVEYKDSNGTLIYGVDGSSTLSYNTYYPIKFTKQGTTISVYFNNVLIDSRTNSDGITTANVGLYSWYDKTGYLKNLKIKAL